MKELLFLKGIIVGIAKVIPGFSGAVLLISFRLYDKAIEAITHFFNHKKKNFLFLLKLGMGILIGIVFFSKIIAFLMVKYYFFTIMFFIGLIFGGIPVVSKKFSINFRHLFLVFFSFLLVIFLSIGHLNFTYIPGHNWVDFVVFLGAGFLEAVGTVVPGVSSTALLMLMGVYSYYLNIISHLFSFSSLIENIYFLIPFSLGMFLGIIVMSLLINYLFHFHKESTFACIFGFSIGSVLLLFIPLIGYFNSFSSIIVGVFLMGLGFLFTYKI